MGLLSALGKRVKGAPAGPDWAAVLQGLAAGRLACSQCGTDRALAEAKPLQMTECPQCKAFQFVPLQIGHFWLLEPLGGGGMGSVYKGRCPTAPSRPFAIKVLAREEKQNPARVSALTTEAAVSKVIGDHPCLVGCVASGYENGEYYLAMEYVEGERIDKLLDRLGKLDEKTVLLIALHILAAEQHIYRKGYLYRDMKPENIILTPDGRAVLLDYGLCLPVAKAQNPSEEFVTGSPYYLPPERMWGRGEDAYSEIYSLGMVLYYALSGQTFFDANEVEELARKHVSKVRLAVGSRLKGFRPELVQILTRMIKQEAAERYQTFDELARDIHTLYQQIEAGTAPAPA